MQPTASIYDFISTLSAADSLVLALTQITMLLYFAGLIILLMAPVTAAPGHPSHRRGGISTTGRKAILLVAPLVVFAPAEIIEHGGSTSEKILMLMMLFLSPLLFGLTGLITKREGFSIKGLTLNIFKTILGASVLVVIMLIFRADYYGLRYQADAHAKAVEEYEVMIAEPAAMGIGSLTLAKQVNISADEKKPYRMIAEIGSLGVGRILWNMNNPEKPAPVIAMPAGAWNMSALDLVGEGDAPGFRIWCHYSDKELVSVTHHLSRIVNYLDTPALKDLTDFCPKTFKEEDVTDPTDYIYAYYLEVMGRPAATAP